MGRADRPDGRMLSHWRGLGNLRVSPIKFFGGFASCDGFFYVGKVAEADILSVVPDLAIPLTYSFVPDHAFVS